MAATDPLAGVATPDLARAALEAAQHLTDLVRSLDKRPRDEVVGAIAAIGPSYPGAEYPNAQDGARALRRLTLSAQLSRMIRLPVQLIYACDGEVGDWRSNWSVKIRVAGSEAVFPEHANADDMHEEPGLYAGILGAFVYEDPEQLAIGAAIDPEGADEASSTALDRAFVAIETFVDLSMTFARYLVKEGQVELRPAKPVLQASLAPEMLAP